jgi:uncharacterized protein YdaU (DUF1376 family)
MTQTLPWLQWFPKDFLADTIGWPPDAVGAYIRLLCASWDQDGLPDDEPTLRQMAGMTKAQWERAWPLIQHRLLIGADGRRRNPRIEQQRADGAARHERRVKASAEANRARWSKTRNSDSKSDPNRIPIGLRIGSQSQSQPQPQSQSQPQSQPPPSAEKISGVDIGIGRDAREPARTKIPSNFALTDDMRTWASTNAPSVGIDEATAAFIDHHTAKGSTFKDWNAAWRTWMRRAIQFGNGATGETDGIDRASAAWTAWTIARALIGNSRTARERCNDPLTDQIVQTLGGWQHLGQQTERELEFLGNRFRAEYVRLTAGAAVTTPTNPTTQEGGERT